MIRTVLLVQSAPPIHYFANRIRDVSTVELVVVERPRWRPRALPRSLRAFAEKVWTGAMSRVEAVANRRAERETYDRLFGQQWESFHPDLPLMVVESINAPAVVERVRDIAPDLLFDHGTTLVRDALIEAAPLALNLHWGLSPWYRGVRCTEWALLHWDPYYIGVTLHHLVRRIDGGEIVAQGRLPITPADTVHSINMGLTRLGTDLALEVLAKLNAGEEIVAVPQDLQRGILSHSRSWSPDLDRQIRRIEREGWIAKMLERPMRR